MIPLLPREFLWTDLQTMDEFFKLDSLNEDFYEVFATLSKEPFGIQIEAVKVFNEVYYQITRMVFERPLPDDLTKYISDIKANLGWNYSAELVMSMAYFMASLIKGVKPSLNRFFAMSINEKYSGCLYWEPFQYRLKLLRNEKRFLKYSFDPRPNKIKDLQNSHIRWREITRGYDLSCIEHVINLWSKTKDQREIALLIKNSMNPLFGINFQKSEIKQVNRFIDKYLRDVPIQSKMISRARMAAIEAQYHMKINEIEELEAENNRLKTLLDENKTTGNERRFTLVEIVDHCKSCSEISQVQGILLMLYKLLRKNGTAEDYVLVDSIEEVFKPRAYGPTTVMNGDIVQQKVIENQILNVEPGGTGVNKEYHKN